MNDATLKVRRVAATVLAALAIVGGTLSLAGCAEVTEAGAAAGPEPAVKEEITEELSSLTLTPQAIERLGLETAEVEAGDGGLTVPYAALIYDHDGDTWVYTTTEPEVFIRAAVVVDRIDGETAHLSEGPEPGTSVVTLGAAELFGAEFDTAH
ncbi:hypothetical protein [Agromyces humatus]|uniref:Uncharacterized protein n=1 Tax=Agromyces humatus TaxID=279573 RepID=A0ABN2KA75_9MICO|nr:hypothetical protein [Agromyces humatus]